MNVPLPPKALIVGAGPAAVAMHLPVLAGLRDRGQLVLEVICDLDPARAEDAQRRFGFVERAGDAVRAMERDDIELVYVFGSAQLHHALGLAALARGKHLFVEKPIAPSFAQACELATAARLNQRVAVGGHNRRFQAGFEQLRRRNGALGWRYAEAIFHKPESSVGPPFGARTWLSANGIHALDALLFMMGGLPQHLYAFASDADAPQSGTFSAIMRWQDGSQGTFLCNNSAGARHEEYVFHRIGETCRIVDGEVVVETNGRKETQPPSAAGDGVAAEHASFLDAIRTGRPPPHAISALAPSLLVCELIERGFCGGVGLPSVPSPNVLSASNQSILVSHPAPFLASIARILPNHPLISVEEVAASSQPRPDIVAAMLGAGSAPLPVSILEKLPRLSIVGVMGLSLARHSPEALLARGVTVVNASESYAGSAAEFTLALAILARRRAFASHELMRAGGWGTNLHGSGLMPSIKAALRVVRPLARGLGVEDFLKRRWRAVAGDVGRSSRAGDLSGARVALIGWGAIARALTLRLAGLQTQVRVYSERGGADEIRAAGALPVSLGEALACDIVSLHRGLTPKTRHFLGSAELEQLRPGTILINTARGALIEPAALLARLRRGDLFACLDTYEDEPLAPSSPLRRLQNVFLTSHIAGGSGDMHAAAAEEVVRKVALHLRDGALEGISLARLSTMT